jgi:pre-mRNA-splicing helicase BRR2
VKIQIQLTREDEDEEDSDEDMEKDEKDDNVEPVYSAWFPKEKDESWWVVLGDEDYSVAIKRITFTKKTANVNLVFDLPEDAKCNADDTKDYKLFLMCDSYLGADHDHDMVLRIDHDL